MSHDPPADPASASRVTIAEVLTALGSNARAFTVTTLLARAVAFTLLWPLAGALLRAVVALSGDPAIADTQIARFLFQPVGAIGLLIVIAISASVIAVELASLLLIARAARTGDGIGARVAVMRALRRSPAIVSVALRVLVRVIAWSLPFVGATALTAFVLLGEHDINHYLDTKPPAFLAAVAIATLLGLALAAVLLPRLASWILALPIVLFEDMTPRDAIRTSTERMHGRRRHTVRALVAWFLLNGVVAAIALAIVHPILNVILPAEPRSLAPVVVRIGLVAAIWTIANVALACLRSASLAVVIEATDEDAAPRGARVAATARTANDAAGDRTADQRGRGLRVVPLTLAVLALVTIAGATGFLLLKGVRGDREIIVIAHRGGFGAPENSLSAIRIGLDAGADMIEIDVQETADGEIVVVHDRDLMRLAGNPVRVAQAPFAELAGIDVGSRHDPPFPEERLAHLRDALELCRDRATLNIELKRYGPTRRLEERTIELVEEAGMADQVVIMSLDHEVARRVKELRPEWTVGLLAATALGDLTRLETDFLAVSTGLASQSFVDRAHDRGLDVYVWTVNDALSISQVAGLGVDGVITDEPALARAILDERAEMTPIERLLVQVTLWLGIEPKALDI